MTAYPNWDDKAEYLAAAEVAMLQVAADVGADTTNVWQSIDSVIVELHKLGDAAASEQRARHDAMVARMEAEDAARRARPAVPPDEVVEEARKLASIGQPALARLAAMGASSMRRDAAAAFVEYLSGSREGADR